MKDLGQKIKILRELQNLTQEHMAERLGMTQPTYCNMEHNGDKIVYDKIERIADLYGMKPEHIINFDKKAVLLYIKNNHIRSIELNEIIAEREYHKKESMKKDETIEGLKSEILSLKSKLKKKK